MKINDRYTLPMTLSIVVIVPMQDLVILLCSCSVSHTLREQVYQSDCRIGMHHGDQICMHTRQMCVPVPLNLIVAHDVTSAFQTMCHAIRNSLHFKSLPLVSGAWEEGASGQR